MDKKTIKNSLLEHKTRIITSIVLLFIVGAVILVDGIFLTWALLGIVYLLAFHEVCGLLHIEDKRLYAIAGILWLIIGWYPQPVLLVLLTIIILSATMIQQQNFEAKYLYAFFYPSISMALIFTLYAYFGMFSLIWLIAIVASTDMSAYIVGKTIGKKQFSSTSPNKTWEGVLGGVAVGAILGTIVGMAFFSFWLSLCVSLAVSVASIWGDLFESYLKREANVKDSGTLLPGHGGMLDRLDGYLFAAPMMLAILEGLV